MNRIPALALAMLISLAPLASFAGAPKPAACVPTVRNAWVRMTPMMPMGAGYFVLENRCKAAVTLSSASSPRFGDVSMHETREENGMSRMRPLARVDVAPGTSVEFKPGGRHLMLMSPKGEITPASRVRVDLKLADGRTLPVDFDVRSATP